MNKSINYNAFPGIQFELVDGKKSFYCRPTDLKITDVIIHSVINEMRVTFEEVIGRSRRKPVRQARQFIHYFVMRFTSMTVVECGRLTNKHHSTVIHSQKTVRNDLNNQTVLEQHNSIENQIKSSSQYKQYNNISE